MTNETIMQLFAAGTVHILIVGILIGSLFSLAIMACLEGLKARRIEKETSTKKKK